MKSKKRINNIAYFYILTIAVIMLIWLAKPGESKAQAIETTSGQLIKVYETELPYEYLSDVGRRSIRICFLGQVYEYGNTYNTIEDLFRLTFADDKRFNEVILLVAYLSLERNQLIFFYIYKDWLASAIPII